jgi:hypothetical protein
MAINVCEGCGETVYRTRFILSQKKFLGVDCGCIGRERIPRSTINPFDIVLEHAVPGQKLHVHNIRELSAAEKTFGFQSVVLNSDAQNFNDPPQQRKLEVSDFYRPKFSRNGERIRR